MFSKIKNNQEKLSLFLLIIGSFLLIILQFHNAAFHPTKRGFDATGHLAYINYLRQHHRIPLPNQGFEFYHPPLYYLLVLPLTYPRLMKMAGFFIWLLTGFFLFQFFQKKHRQRAVSLSATIAIMGLPVFLYQSISISNEFLSISLIMVSLIYYLRYLKRERSKSWLILGFLAGLAILTKATGLILIPTIFLSEIIIYFINKKKENIFNNLFIFTFVTSIVGGWIYLRNWLLFKNPLITGTDFPKLFSIDQPVVPRTLNFFLNPASLWKLDMFHAQHYSFLGGTLFSFFYDSHNIVIPVQPFSKIGALIIILSLPLLIASLIGFWQTKNKWGREIVLPIYSFLLIAAYVLYNFKFPFYSAVKGTYIASLALPYGYYLSKFINRRRRYLLIFAFFFFAYALILTKAFWFRFGWY